MNITEESFGKNYGDMFDLFSKLNTEEDFKNFYLVYKDLIEETIKEEEGLEWGDDRPIGKTIKRLHSNLYYLLSRYGEGNSFKSSKANFARKIWWFL